MVTNCFLVHLQINTSAVNFGDKKLKCNFFIGVGFGKMLCVLWYIGRWRFSQASGIIPIIFISLKIVPPLQRLDLISTSWNINSFVESFINQSWLFFANAVIYVTDFKAMLKDIIAGNDITFFVIIIKIWMDAKLAIFSKKRKKGNCWCGFAARYSFFLP